MRRKDKARLYDVIHKERGMGIGRATAALREAEVEDEKIIYLLQKYWDLRLSEASEFSRIQKEFIKEK